MHTIEFPDGSRGSCDDIKRYTAGDFGKERRAAVVIGEVNVHAGDEVHRKVMSLRRENAKLSYAQALKFVLSDPKNAELKTRFAREG
jgi:hypothetical protein